MTVPAIIETARRALYGIEELCWDQDDERKVNTVIAAVAPLIRAQVLEEAAAFFETCGEDYPSEGDWLMRGDVAAQLRALISPSPSPSSDSA